MCGFLRGSHLSAQPALPLLLKMNHIPSNPGNSNDSTREKYRVPADLSPLIFMLIKARDSLDEMEAISQSVIDNYSKIGLIDALLKRGRARYARGRALLAVKGE